MSFAISGGRAPGSRNIMPVYAQTHRKPRSKKADESKTADNPVNGGIIKGAVGMAVDPPSPEHMSVFTPCYRPLKKNLMPSSSPTTPQSVVTLSAEHFPELSETMIEKRLAGMGPAILSVETAVIEIPDNAAARTVSIPYIIIHTLPLSPGQIRKLTAAMDFLKVPQQDRVPYVVCSGSDGITGGYHPINAALNAMIRHSQRKLTPVLGGG